MIADTEVLAWAGGAGVCVCVCVCVCVFVCVCVCWWTLRNHAPDHTVRSMLYARPEWGCLAHVAVEEILRLQRAFQNTHSVDTENRMVSVGGRCVERTWSTEGRQRADREQTDREQIESR
jgi:hypothetical protein